jgi:hypothetical protein
MDYCTVTPTRGDRPKLLDFCKHQLDRMGEGRPSFIIDYKPIGTTPDLVPRIKVGIELAKKAGAEYVFIVEDDDFYPENYLRTKVLDFDFFGYNTTMYYNLKTRSYATFPHKNRSSLFCTGFKVSAMEGFRWPSDTSVFLDLEIWDYAIRKKKKVVLEQKNPCLGIKHGLGLCGGKGHRWDMVHKDKNYEFLKKTVDSDAFEFYKSLGL